MKRLFHVGQEVLARVSGFEPFPAIIHSVRLAEDECAVFYYVRFNGTTEIVPLNGESLEPLVEKKHRSKLKYNDKELKRESKMRVDALMGAEDEIPEVLMNFISVDSDFEEVSEDAVKHLGLYSIKLTPSMVNRLDKKLAVGNGNAQENLTDDDEYVDVEDVNAKDTSRLLSDGSAFPCSTCFNVFKSRKALRIHKQRSVLCRKLSMRHANQAKQNKSRKNKMIGALGTDKSDLKKSKWASRSASGFYPCKLCFRKFRSKGEAQQHIASHKVHVHKEINKTSSAEDGMEWPSEESDSGGNEEGGKSRELHCSLERQRRSEMKSKFAELAAAIDLEAGASKVRVLAAAKSHIEELEIEAEKLDQELASLQERNQRLKNTYMEMKTSC